MIWIDGTLVSPGVGGVYGERILKGYRVWDPFRSKFAALCMLRREIELGREMRVLYLGAAHGTTVSHFADYVEVVYAVEIAPRPMKHLLEVAGKRENVIPIMADARRPEEYAALVEEVDLLYQDVAAPEQTWIALRNRIFLSRGGRLILMLKAPCIDSSLRPEAVLQDTTGALQSGYGVDEAVWLIPYYPDHAAILGHRKD